MPSNCNKCKTGTCREGDSWCLGCSSLEFSQGLLKQSWNHPGIRAVCEETLLSGARLTKAFFNLDRTLGRSADTNASGSHRVPRASRARSRTPPRDERPPISRTLPPPPLPRGGIRREAKEEEESEERFEEEEESEEEDARVSGASAKSRPEDKRAPKEPAGHPPGHFNRHHREEGSGRHHRGGRKRRGGSKRQQHWKSEHNPFRRTHRRLRADDVELASSFRDGVERRA